MRRQIDKLLLGAISPPFLISLTVLTFVIFVRELGRLSELFITRNASLAVIAWIAGTIVPGILVFSLPLSFLIGTLIGMSGLSAESQITALRACGVPLRRLILPIIGLAVVVCLLTSFLSLYVLPRSSDMLSSLKYQISLRQAASQVRARVFNEDFPDVVFYLDDLATDRQVWSRVFVADSSDRDAPKIILAREGMWLTDPGGGRLQLHLIDGRIYQVDPQDKTRDNVSLFASTDIPVGLNGKAAESSGNGAARSPQKPVEMSTTALWRGFPGASKVERRDRVIELYRRLALPFSVLGFALIALPLGVSTGKKGRTAGFVLSLLLVVFFYTMLMNGIRLASVGRLTPWVGVWLGNFILLALGIILLINAEQGGRLGRLVQEWRWKSRRTDAGAITPSGLPASSVIITWPVVSLCGRVARRCVPKVFDYYVSKGFLLYLGWSALACGALFIVLTLFELLDDVVRNQVPLIIVADYLFSLIPQILVLMVPMAVLLATLIHFGILEKSSEITAIKAGGWSLYRVAWPVMILSGLVCCGLFLVQDYVLPYANMRQDRLRNLIKGRPAQTLNPQRKWIFGESGRIFNYDHFDATQGVFVGLRVFEIEMSGLRILRRIEAARATIFRSGSWILENGWLHDFRPDGVGVERLDKKEFNFPEKAAYFKRELFEPKESSKLTFLELKRYIIYLQKSGYNATELQVELYKKLSLPSSALVMALLGVPFSFSMGKRGAFYGIGASIVIAMIYWGVFSMFEQMGSYGLLIPALAAWAPNILFAAAGLILLLTIRT